MTSTQPEPSSVAGPIRTAVAFEAGVWRSLWRWIARRPRSSDPGGVTFGYAAPVQPLIWVFIGVSAVEVPVVHFILPWHTVRVIALVVGIWGLIWMLGYLASLTVYPHVVSDIGLRVRNGVTVDILLDWYDVATIRVQSRNLPNSRTVQLEDTDAGTTLNVAVGGQTNVYVTLERPVTVPLPKGPATITTLRFHADDPKALVKLAREG